MKQHVVRDGADEQPSEPAQTARPSDDQVGAPVGRSRLDLPWSVAIADSAGSAPSAGHETGRHLVSHHAVTVDIVYRVGWPLVHDRQRGDQRRAHMISDGRRHA